jgi:hypothetical protein
VVAVSLPQNPKTPIREIVKYKNYLS